jgi:histone H3/H4
MSKKYMRLNAINKIVNDSSISRASLGAKNKIKELIEQKIFRIIENSMVIAKHNNRKTVLKKDVSFAIEMEEKE